jgi:hypothetical protein
MVHYVSHGTPIRSDGSQAFASVCRSAVITELAEPGSPMEANHVVGLCVINPTGLFFHPLAAGGVPFDDGHVKTYDADGPVDTVHNGGTWHWPERV